MFRPFVLTLALASFGLSAAAQAQPPVVVGTSDDFPFEYVSTGNDAQLVGQTFTAIGPRISRLSVWFRGGTRRVFENGELETNFFSRLYLVEGDVLFGQNPNILFRSGTLLQQHTGRVDFAFATPLDLVVGNVYSIGVFSDICYDECGGASPVPIAETFRDPAVLVAQGDAYSGGAFIDVDGELYPDRDMRFELVFGVPEPGAMALAVLTLLGLGGVGMRRRHDGDARHRT